MSEIPMNSDAMIGRIELSLGQPSSRTRRTTANRPPPVIANYQLIACIGDGSYGDVWLARSVTGALHAIKVVWRSRFDSDRPYEREFRGIVRFEPLSRSHPGVIHILHVGRDDVAGYFFYAMELADAVAPPAGSPTPETREAKLPDYVPRTLASDLKTRTRLPVMETVALGVQLADAVGHLHRNGLVHRDIKPSNVIFVNGQAKLADIGLVTGVQEDRSFVGTEGYIPPEGPGTERADLYALGRLLYESATGLHRSEFPSLPADLDRWPKNEREQLIEFSEVVARASAPDAKNRHTNAAELGGDLNLILAGRSVRRAYRLEGRLRQAKWMAAVAVALLFATACFSWLQRRQRAISDAQAARETGLRVEAQHALAAAEAAEKESRRRLYTALLEQARATVLSGEMGQRVRALEALSGAAAISNSVELRREVFAALALPDLRFDHQLPYGEEFTMRRLAPSFARVALCQGRGPVEIRTSADGHLLATLPASTNLVAFVGIWSADEQFLAVKRDHPGGGLRADWEIWQTADARQILLLRDLPLGAAAFHPQLPRVFLGTDRGATLWDIPSGEPIAHFPLPGTPVLLQFVGDGQRFAAMYSAAGSSIISVHDATVPSAPPIATHTFPARVANVEWHPSGRWLAISDYRGDVHWMDAQTGATRILGRHKAEATEVEFSPDGAYLASGGWGYDMIFWDARTLHRAFNFKADGFRAQFSRSGQAFSVQTRSAIRIHTFEPPRGHREFAEDLGSRLSQAAFSLDGRWLAAAGDKQLGVWDLTQPGPGALDDRGQDVKCFFTTDGRELFGSRSREGKSVGAYRWGITPSAQPGTPPHLEHLALAKPAGFTYLSLQSNSIAITSTNGTRILAPAQIDSPQEDWRPTVAGQNRLSPDGRWLGVFAHRSPALFVYQMPGLEPIARLTHRSSIHGVEFSPLGDEVTLYSSRGVEQWSIATWEQTRCLTNFSRPMLYAPDGRALWLTKDLRAAGLYDARTLEPLLLLPEGMLPLAVSADSRHLAVSVDAQRLQVWDLAEVRRRLREIGLDWAETR